MGCEYPGHALLPWQLTCDRMRVNQGLCDATPPVTHHVEALPALPLLVW